MCRTKSTSGKLEIINFMERVKMDMELGMEDGLSRMEDGVNAAPLGSCGHGSDSGKYGDVVCACDSLDGQEIDLHPDMSEMYAEGVRNGILCEAAISASKEADYIAEMASKCRMELFEILLKSDLDKEKIKEKVKSLQEFMASSERRTDDLIMRVERLLKK